MSLDSTHTDALPVVVVGNGPVGNGFARALSAEQPSLPVAVFDGESWDTSRRAGLAGVLSGGLDWSDLEGQRQGFAEPAITLHHRAVVAIDRRKQQVVDDQGRRHGYRCLVLATGSRSRVPKIPGCGRDGVFTFRNKRDAERLVERLGRCGGRVAVVGGGLMGLEITAALSQGAGDVLVVEGERLMARQLDVVASGLLLAHLRRRGIEVVLEPLAEIVGTASVQGVRTAGGKTLACSAVVMAVGTAPAIELAELAGLATGRGIQVDAELRTSDPSIYAIGECAEHRGRIYGLVAPGLEQAAVVARLIAGRKARYSGSMVTSRLKGVALPVVAMEAAAQKEGGVFQEIAYSDPHSGVYRKLALQRGRIIAAAGVGEWPEAGRMESAVRRGRRLWPWQQRRFCQTGSPWPSSSAAGIARWPGDALVCQCRGLNKTAVLSAAAGCDTVEALACATGAGWGCGSCKPLLADLLGQKAAADAAGERDRRFAYACGAALVTVVLLFLSPAAPAPHSVRGLWRLTALWSDSWCEQVSGYAVALLSVLAAGLSLRKRWSRCGAGRYANWRYVHALAGIAILALLALHTGFSLGSGLISHALLLCFLALSALGAARGLLVASAAYAASRSCNRLALWLGRCHVYVMWPVPALLAAHVVSAYYF